MFVKVIGSDFEDLYECSRANHRDHPDSTNILIMTIQTLDGEEESFEVDKEDAEIYFMNSDGRTVDKLVWR